MMLKYIIFIILVTVSLPSISGCQASQPEPSAPDSLAPSQVNSSMVDQVVKVRGKVLSVVQNPGGLGGIYAELGDSSGKVGVRIKREIWDSLDDNVKAQFKEGKTTTVTGVLFQAGKQLVVVFSRSQP